MSVSVCTPTLKVTVAGVDVTQYVAEAHVSLGIDLMTSEATIDFVQPIGVNPYDLVYVYAGLTEVNGQVLRFGGYAVLPEDTNWVYTEQLSAKGPLYMCDLVVAPDDIWADELAVQQAFAWAQPWNAPGVDLSNAQWTQLIEVLKKRLLLPYLDIAYQGFGDGIEEDAFALRALADAGVSFFVANSFSKSFSLYGERVGGLSVVCPDKAQAQLVLGQLMSAVRRNYSSPPTHGAQIVARVLQSGELRQLWADELTDMRQRIKVMRQRLYDGVVARMSDRVPGRDVRYFIDQRGMFSYTGVSPEQADALRVEHGVYVLRSGRMCAAGLNANNVDAVAKAFAAVL